MNEKYIRVELFLDFLDRNARDDLLTPADIGTALEMIPSEDVEPVRHAHWIEFTSNNGNVHCKCSHCGKEVSYPYAKKRWKYCIECGAKMDEEEGK